MSEQRNLILAIVLSGIVLFGWQMFIAKPQLDAERAKVVLLVGIVGMAEIVEHCYGLDDAVDGVLAERGDADPRARDRPARARLESLHQGLSHRGRHVETRGIVSAHAH